MKVLIIGAGAVGSYIGAHIAHSGQRVALVDREQALEAINRNGIAVQLPDGRAFQTSNFQTYTSVEAAAQESQINSTPYDVVLLCVKAYSLDEVTHRLSHFTNLFYPPADDRRTLLVVFQNGVGNEEKVAELFGRDRTIAATTTSPVSLLAPGIVKVERASGSICLASVSESENRQRDHAQSGMGRIKTQNRSFIQLCQTLWKTSIPIKIYDDYRALKWSKLLLNMMGNATSAILDLPVAQVYADRRLFTFEMQMLDEAVCVMKKLAVRPLNLPHFPAATLALAVSHLPWSVLQPVLLWRLSQGRGAKRPSFYYDVENHTGHSEVGWLNGAVAQYGQYFGVPIPVNQRLNETLTGIVTGATTREEWRGNIQRLITF